MPTFATVIHLCKILHVNVYMYTLCDINPKEKRRWLNTKAHIFTLFSNFLVSLTLFKLMFLPASLQFCQFFKHQDGMLLSVLLPGSIGRDPATSYISHSQLSCGVCFTMLWKSTSLPFRQSNFVDYFVRWAWWGDERQRAISGHKRSLLQHFACWGRMDEIRNCTGPKMSLLSSLYWGPDWASTLIFTCLFAF